MNNPIFNYLFPFLNKLNNGSIIRKLLSNIIKIFAFLTVIIVLFGAIFMTNIAIKLQVPVGGFFALFFAILLLIVFSIIAMQIQLFHATEIANLPNSPFTITHIISVSIRMFGETYALFVLTVGIIMSILTLFSASGIISQLPIGSYFNSNSFDYFSGGGVFLASLGILLGSFFTALFTLIGMYLVSELLVVITDIATNVRQILYSGQGIGIDNNNSFNQEIVSTNFNSPINNVKIISIGRSSDCTIIVNDTTVSKIHAEIILDNGSTTIRDLGSTNGTFVNGMKITSTEFLKSNDIVKTGNSIVEWQKYI